MNRHTVHIVGAGPAGLMAAERLAAAGHGVVVHEAMPSPSRKLLMAGRGGLNLTHTEPLDGFLGRYGAARAVVSDWLERLSPTDLIGWTEGLGQATFVGSSGRVFPRAMKASPLLRAWLARLAAAGVELRTRSRWTGFSEGGLTFDTPAGQRIERPDAVVLALGGASWPRLGSDARWLPWLEARGVSVTPFKPSNVGFDRPWSSVFIDRFAGQPLKPVALTHGETTVRGEALVTRYGIEGGAVYALSAGLRDAIAADGTATLVVDLRPDLSIDALSARLAKPRGKDSVTNWLRKAGGLSPVAVGLLREIPGDLPMGAISSAGGVALDQVDQGLMLKALPGVFVAGEMLDWEAPTGGYLLQASLASGAVAAAGATAWLARV
jgi:uncharacterized flavoprotein (TIGR03862 family)